MNFSKFVCWRMQNIERVLETEALQTSDAVFLATHHPLAMVRQSWVDAVDSEAYTEDQFLSDFLKPNDYVLVPVLGEAGTGKSHLIRWLDLNIPKSKKRHVILIPKVGTNLRGVIRLILQHFSGPDFDDYRRQLKEATEHLNVDQAAQKLLDNLAFEVGPNRTAGIQNLTETQRYFVDSLPALLYDPHFRNRFLASGGLLLRLAEHVLGRAQRVERLSEHRKFAAEDLPLNLPDLRKASDAARLVYSDLLGSKELQEQAVDWLNSNLDSAVASLLELRGDKLSNLLLEIRKRLATSGVELILLIEDFARLQGIESQLLEALLVRPHQGAIGELCTLRTALGCTAGYFKPLIETVRQRTSFVINLDTLSEPGAQLDKPVDLATFAARYLNAIRVPEEALQRWYLSTRSDDDKEDFPLPNHCSTCDFRSECHRAFGERLGIGLYPFTSKALQRMNERKNPGAFNPRKFVLWVLKHTFENYTGDFKTSQFPSAALHQYFGRRLDPLIQQRLQVLDTRNAQRREALLDLYDNGLEIVNLDPVIHRAFDLPELPGSGQPPTPRPPKEKVKPAPPEPPTVPAPQQNEDIELIRQWANGSRKLSQDLVNKLRQRLHKSIVHHIDWDSERLKRDYFVSGLWFLTRSINFQNQATQPSPVPLMLLIPEKPTTPAMRHTGLALEGMLRCEEIGSWDFQNGADYLRHFMRLIDDCSVKVLASIRRPVKDDPEWSPVPTIVQVLAIIAVLDGLSLKSGTDLLNGSNRQDASSRSKKWRELVESLANYRSELEELLLAYTACTKGSGAVQYVDAAQFQKPFITLRKTDWVLTAPMSELTDNRFDKLRRAYKRIQEHIDGAVEEEKAHWTDWADRVTGSLGETPNYRQLLHDVRSARDLALKVGTLPQVYRQPDFEAALQAFEVAPVVEALQAAQSVEKQKSRARVLELLTQDHSLAITAADRFLEVVRPVLDGAIKRLNTELSGTSSGTEADVTRMRTEISDALESIAKDLSKLSGGT